MDFVGHRKAIEAVQFNSHLFLIDDDQHQGCIAIGSRDRSLSVWLTRLKRPLVVIHDLFNNSILDLSWSSDGYQLMACSLDGTVCFMSFSDVELGKPSDQNSIDGLFINLYGNKRLSCSTDVKSNLIIEDPSLFNVNISTANEAVKTTPVKSQSLTDHLKGDVLPVAKQQVESRTTDGRRRITPVMISDNPTSSLTNSPFATTPITATTPIAATTPTKFESQSKKDFPDIKSPPAHPVSFSALSSPVTKTTVSMTTKPAPPRQKRPLEVDALTTDSTSKLKKSKKAVSKNNDDNISTIKKLPPSSVAILSPPSLSSSLSLQIPPSLLGGDPMFVEVINHASMGVVTCNSGGEALWSVPLYSPALILSANHLTVTLASTDNTITFLSTLTGQLLFPRLQLQGSPYKVVTVTTYVAIATTQCRLFVYDMSLVKVILEGVPFDHVISNSTHLVDIVLMKNGTPVVMTTNGSYVYHLPIAGWVELSNPKEKSEIYSPKLMLSPDQRSATMPLQSIQELVVGGASVTTPTHITDRESSTLLYLEAQLHRCTMLGSSLEHTHWLKTYVRYLVDKNLPERLKEYCTTALMNNRQFHEQDIVMSDVLSIVATNPSLQRLHKELQDIFDSYKVK
jgi:protein HIRA/HIR1